MKTVRWRSGQAYVGLRASLTRGDLDAQAQDIIKAYVQWESQPLALAGGARITSGYVLWLPESRLVQPPTTGLVLGDAPPLREPPPPDLDLHALRYDLDQEIDYQPPIAPAPQSPARRRRRNAGPARKKTTRYKGVTRIDREPGRQPDGRRITATHGYMVRVFWRKERHQAFFSDLKYGDRLAALDAAVAWRDHTEARIGKPRTDRTVIGYANSNTGELGISRRTVCGHAVFEVAWRDPSGKAWRTRYSIDKNGEKRALQKAKQARRRGELRRVQEPPERKGSSCLRPAVGRRSLEANCDHTGKLPGCGWSPMRLRSSWYWSFDSPRSLRHYSALATRPAECYDVVMLWALRQMTNPGVAKHPW
jgi:hypothetical protein